MSSPTDLTIEERLAALEALLGPAVTPLALTPPITVGSLTNVPSPGGQIAAQWAQDASSMVVHRFPNAATLTAWVAATGTLAVATDTTILYERVAGGWVQLGSNPVGTIRSTIAAAADVGWLLLNGQAIANGNALYPALYALAPSSWKSSGTLTLPNAADRVMLGAGTGALASLGGANSRAISVAHLPSHTHPITADGDHAHSPGDGWAEFAVQGPGGAGGFNIVAGNRQPTSVTSTSNNGAHGHGGATQATGSGTALDTTPAFIAVNWQIKF